MLIASAESGKNTLISHPSISLIIYMTTKNVKTIAKDTQKNNHFLLSNKSHPFNLLFILFVYAYFYNRLQLTPLLHKIYYKLI